MAAAVTPLQLAIFEHCRDMLAEGGFAPSYPELMDRFGIASKGQLAKIIDRIVAEGALVRTAAKQRNLALPASATEVDLTRIATGQLQAELARRGAPVRRPRRLFEQAASKPCPAPGCAERVTRGQFYCRTHWFALPKGLRVELHEAIRRHDEAALGDAWQRSQDCLELGA